MFAEERRSRLLELVRVRRFAALPELTTVLDVSESTIRRDLDHLEEQGSIRRIHGGVLYAGDSAMLPDFEARQTAEIDQKRAIARAAVDLIADGESVVLDGGSSTYEVARLLLGRSLHIVTTSLAVANLIAPDTRSELVLIGGNICPRTGVARGPYADNMLRQVRASKAILSVAGIKEDGLFNNNLLLVATEQAMMEAADEVIVVADSTKFGRQSLGHLCPLEKIDRIVVDGGIPKNWQETVTAAGVDLLIAEPVKI